MRIFLDTNVYIIAQLDKNSSENFILAWLEANVNNPTIQVVISQELIEQILRVGKRIQNKDWAASVVDKIWKNLNCFFVPETEAMRQEINEVIATQNIPSEDILIYVTAKLGRTDYFISANRELIRNIADFQCFNANDFVQRFLI